ncbi:MAG: hypothetical protein KA436_06460 [Oligoflexales bacterium]|nr:hypothetical protein [Oligoflexales bacterium]
MKRHVILKFLLCGFLPWSTAQARGLDAPACEGHFERPELEQAEACSAVYLQAAGRMGETMRDVSVLTLGGPFTGLGLAVGQLVSYATDEVTSALDDVLGVGINGEHETVGDEQFKTSPKDALRLAMTEVLISAFGPLGAVSLPILYAQALETKRMGLAFKELETLGQVKEGDSLPPELEHLYHFVKRASPFTNLHDHLPVSLLTPKLFVSTLKQAVDRRALCPEGTVYSRHFVKKILRGFALTPGYRIPYKVFKHSRWAKLSLFENLRDYQNYRSHHATKRLMRLNDQPSLLSLYEGSPVPSLCGSL